MDELLGALLQLYPLPSGSTLVSEDELPPARVSIEETTLEALKGCHDPLEDDSEFHIATVRVNKRITAEDWFQDVRHLQFDFNDDIQSVYDGPPL